MTKSNDRTEVNVFAILFVDSLFPNLDQSYIEFLTSPSLRRCRRIRWQDGSTTASTPTSKLKKVILSLTRKRATYYLITVYWTTSLWQTSQKYHLERSHLEKWHLETGWQLENGWQIWWRAFSKCLAFQLAHVFPSGLSKCPNPLNSWWPLRCSKMLVPYYNNHGWVDRPVRFDLERFSSV